MKKSILFLMALAMLFSIMCCTKNKASKETAMVLNEDQSIASWVGEWKLVQLMKGEEAQTIAEATLFVEYREDNIYNISGSLGGNLFTGGITSDKANTVKTISIGSTMMAVPEELYEFEMIYSKLLATMDSYKIGKYPNEAMTTLEVTSSSENLSAKFIK